MRHIQALGLAGLGIITVAIGAVMIDEVPTLNWSKALGYALVSIGTAAVLGLVKHMSEQPDHQNSLPSGEL